MEALLDKLSNTAAVSASATGWAAFYPPPDLKPAKKKHYTWGGSNRILGQAT